MLVLGVGVFAFAASRVRSVRRLPQWRLLATSYCFLLAGWAATTFEALFQQSVLNWVEHSAYAAGAILAAVWCWLGPRHLEDER